MGEAKRRGTLGERIQQAKTGVRSVKLLTGKGRRKWRWWRGKNETK